MLTPILLAAALTAADPATTLTEWFASIAARQLDKREVEGARDPKTKDQAEARKLHTREALLKSLNGLPDYKGPLNARTLAARSTPAPIQLRSSPTRACLAT